MNRRASKIRAMLLRKQAFFWSFVTDCSCFIKPYFFSLIWCPVIYFILKAFKMKGTLGKN